MIDGETAVAAVAMSLAHDERVVRQCREDYVLALVGGVLMVLGFVVAVVGLVLL